MGHTVKDGDDRQDGATVAVVTVLVAVVGVTTRSSVALDPLLLSLMMPGVDEWSR